MMRVSLVLLPHADSSHPSRRLHTLTSYVIQSSLVLYSQTLSYGISLYNCICDSNDLFDHPTAINGWLVVLGLAAL